MTEPGKARVTLNLAPGADTGAEEAEQLARRLRAELAGLNLELLEALSPVELSADTRRSLSLPLVGSSVHLPMIRGGVSALVAVVRSWLGRENRSHKIQLSIDGDTLELANVTPEQQDQLIDAFIQRHAGS